MALNALFLGAPDPVSMGIARGWQLAGHRIAAIWYPDRLVGTREFEKDRAMAQRAPGVSLHGLAERGGVAVRPVPPLAGWAEVNAEAVMLCADVVISAMFLDRIPRTMLSAFPGRVVNLHPSLLPAYRGRYPVFNMLWDRTIQQYGGMTLHLVSPEFDAGDMLGQTQVNYPANLNLAVFNMHLVKAGAALLAERLPHYLAGELEPLSQPAGDARQGTRRPSQALLTSSLAADEMAWLCATIPQMAPLRIDGALNVVATRFLEVVGPPTGAPPLIEDAAVTLDARDGRVRLACAP